MSNTSPEALTDALVAAGEVVVAESPLAPSAASRPPVHPAAKDSATVAAGT
ncbi:MAG: hypothetical protein ACRD0G_11995 [Acidimicrobiales bacterium]